ncbi:MAG TPA: protein kinase [Thermoanaerobaculia bacterium]|nr:protein kinase [Thermoanaerobaculia bacterium]
MLSLLGAGGMGEVYRARDTRLNREVAIKVLPAELAGDASRLRRFEKEARSASALNHPNIVTVYDIGSEGGVSYIAMEKVEGETLRKLLAGGALPIRKLLSTATQIAEGLAKAHEAGIVHRDLKPENLMVTKDGLVKIMDFGLAKPARTVSGSDEGSHLPTETETSPGIVVGTVGYMSPEQASGEPVDFHSDQFAFGSILYEMATGKRAFLKKTGVDTLGAILNEEPTPIGSINPQLPAPLRWIVERCLAKEAGNRYVATRDLARELASVQAHLSEATSGALPGQIEPRRRSAMRLPAMVAAALALLVIAILVGRWVISRNVNVTVPTFHQLTFRRGNILQARFTPDGRTVVYSAAWDGAPAEVFSVRPDSTVSTPTGLTEADVMSVSSKGELAVLIKKKLKNVPLGTGTLARVPLAGGSPRELLESVFRADWAPNGEDLAVGRVMPDRRYRLEYPIGTTLYEGSDPFEIRVSPRGDLVAIEPGGTLLTVDRKGARRIISTGWRETAGLKWSAGGDELIVCGSREPSQMAIYAVSLAGKERVLLPNALGMFLQDGSADGRLLVESCHSRSGILVRLKGEARERELGWLQDSSLEAISPDASYIVFFSRGESFLRKMDGAAPVRIGEGSVADISPDSQWLLLQKPGPPPELVMVPVGAGASKKIPVEGLEPQGAVFLPRGRGFVVASRDKNGNDVLAVVGPDGGKARILGTEAYAPNPRTAISPDGDHLAYVGKDGKVRILALSDGRTSTVPGVTLDHTDNIMKWTSDGRFLLLRHPIEIPARIDRLEISTGRREIWRRLMPEDPTGLIALGWIQACPDDETYAYTYIRNLVDDLYLVEGVK